MKTQNIDIFQRLEKIEKQNLRIKSVNYILILLILSGLLIAWQVEKNFYKVIETEKISIIDRNGIERAVIFYDNIDNAMRFRMKNAKGETLSSIGATEESGFIYLSTKSNESDNYFYLSSDEASLNNNNERVFGWGLNDKDNTYFIVGKNNDLHLTLLNDRIMLLDKISAVRIGLFAESDLFDGAEFVMRTPTNYILEDTMVVLKGTMDPNELFTYGMAETKFRIVATGNSVFQSFYDNDGNEQVVISSNDDGSRQISFLNSVKKYIQSMFVNKDNDCGYRIYDNNENLRVAIGNISLMKNGNDYKTGISSVNLFNSAGNIIFTTEE